MQTPGRVGQASGKIVLVATPIGNLGDLSPRAVETLAGADVVCCEDTRRTRQLLTHTGIRGRRLVALHEHNEAATAARLVEQAASGAVIVVVSDAGLPGVSDPGERLVRAAVEAGVDVNVVPGPSAATAALVGSGLPCSRFFFEGFLPRKGGERDARLATIAAFPDTVVLYEAPTRVARTVDDLAGRCGDGRPVAFARELTKLHEEWWRGTLGEARAWLAGASPKGEWVIVLGGAPQKRPDVDDETLVAALQVHLDAGADRRSAIAEVVSETGAARRRVYQLATTLPR